MLARKSENFIEDGIDLKVFHEVISVNSNLKKIKIKDLKSEKVFEDSYDKLMIATGASSIIPPIKNINIGNVSNLKTLNDGIKLKKLMENEEIKKVAIIGVGFIGLEVIEAAKNREGSNYISIRI